MDEQTAIRAAIGELHRGGVTVDLAANEAVEMVIDANFPAEVHGALGARPRRRIKTIEKASNLPT